MKQHNRHNNGVTLVELLVVMAIIATLATASIPVMSRLGAFSSNRNQGAARELFTILKAAQIYASTHNTDTAVIYYPRDFTDSWDEGSSPAFDSYMVVRRVKNDELVAPWTYLVLHQERIDEGNIINGTLGDHLAQFFAHHYDDFLGIDDAFQWPRSSDVFVPIRNTDYLFREFPRETSLLLRPNPDLRGESGTDGDPFYDANSFHKNTGMTGVLVFNPWWEGDTGNFIYPPSNPLQGVAQIRYGDGNQQGDYWMTRFPGHVFKPTGDVLLDSSFEFKERVTLHMGAKPDRGPDDRFFANPDKSGNYNGDDPFLKDDNGLIPLVTKLRLFISTGRPKIES